MSSAFVYSAVRTPFGRYGGALAGVRTDDLASGVLSELLATTPHLNYERISDVVFGNANGAGEDNRDVARMAILLAGLPVTVPGTTVNRLCGSSLDAAMIGSRMIETGDAEVVVAGGVESMSRSPWVVPKPDRSFPPGDAALVSTALGWRLVNPRMPAEWTTSNGEANEQLAERLGVSRDRQDAFAERSHRLAVQAWADGFYDRLVVPVGNVDLKRDEGIREDSTTEALGRLKPSFRAEGTITAGNASPLSDGASAVLIGSEQASAAIGTEPVARIAGRGTVGSEPPEFGFAPVAAANQAVERAGIDWSDVGSVELNEAFAAQAVACVEAWPIDAQIVNLRGGAIAIGHPLGASGGRLLGTLAARLRDEHERWGVAAICIGVGQALAVVLENTEVA